MKKKEAQPPWSFRNFNNVDVSRIAEEIDFRPKQESVYLYAIKKDKETDEDWKCDGYTFWQNGSRKVKVNEHGLDLLSTYFKLINVKVEDGRLKRNMHGN